jgi:threonine dehydratase
MAAWIAGVDGCRAGWIVARQAVASGGQVELGQVEITIHPRFAAILDPDDPPAAIAIDMPIGLPAVIGAEGRGPERIVRRLLGARRSSVFAIPARPAIEATDYAVSCLAAAASSQPSRKVSKQAFMLFPKIREVDGLMRASGPEKGPAWRDRVFEAHPELAFCRLNDGRPLSHPKKLKGRPYPEGLSERRGILRSAGFPEAVVMAKPPRGAALDDLLDSLALLATARRILDGRAKPHPDPPGRDAFGLPIAIWG